jgi:prophage regulatory protein
VTQANPSKSAPHERLLRLPEVESMVGLRKSSIYEGIKAGTFPAPVKLSRRAVCWPASAIDAWIADRIKTGGK